MPRFLALDWTAQHMLVVSATIRRGTVTLERAAAWPEQHGPTPESARALGPTLANGSRRPASPRRRSWRALAATR